MRRGGRWGLAALAVGVVLVGVTYGAGRTLPVEHLASSAMVYREPADTIWSHVRDISRYAEWWPDIESTRLVPDVEGREVWQLANRRDPGFPMVVVVSEPPHRLVTRVIDDGLPFGGTWTYEVTALDAGTRLTITEDGRIYSPIFRAVSRWFMGYHGTQEGFLTALAEYLGDTPAVERVQ